MFLSQNKKWIGKFVFTTAFFVLPFSQLISYERPTNLDPATWAEAEPYFLPENHPLRKKLDDVFSKARVTLTQETLKKAHFKTKRHGHWSNLTVAKIRGIKNFVVKLYTDDQVGINELPYFIKRIKGAKAVEDAIKKFGYQRVFKVPKKWIYPLPEHPSVPSGPYQQKYFILIAQDMHLSSHDYNHQQWKQINRIKLDYLYDIINEAGLVDSVYIDNIPFCKDMRIAFIDTEHYNIWPIAYHKLNKFLTSSKKHHWMKVTGQVVPLQ